MIIKVILIKKDNDDLSKTKIEVKESYFDNITALENYYSRQIDKLIKEELK